MINLNQYRHVLALAEECHFARAAHRVNLSQPAFSRSIQTVESLLGMRLFERQRGEVRPTPAGRFLVERARSLLFDARCLERDLGLYREHHLGDVAFGMGPMPSATLAARVIAQVRQQYPQIKFHLEINNWALLLERLLSEDIEFFVAEVRDLPDNPALLIEPLMRQSAHFYVRAGHPLGDGVHSLSELWAYGLGMTRIPTALKQLLAQLLGVSISAASRPALECDDPYLLRQIGLNTDTVIATTDLSVADLVAAGSLRALVVTQMPPLFAEIGIVRLRLRTLSPTALKLIETFSEHAALSVGAAS
jgi:DNA-binding transcriptional LysR family regulator